MDPMRRAATAYGQAAETLPPLQQIVLLYDGAIRRLKEAKAAGEAGRIGQRAAAVDKAAAIIDALHGCLDRERGGDIAANLERLYSHLAFRIQEINIQGDVSICDEVAWHLAELRTAWATLLHQSGSAASPTGAAPASAGAHSGASLSVAVQA